MKRDRLTHPVDPLNGRAVATHRAVAIQREALAHRVDVTLVRANLGVVCVAVNLRDSTRLVAVQADLVGVRRFDAELGVADPHRRLVVLIGR